MTPHFLHLLLLLLLLPFTTTKAHSMMSEPQSMSPKVCRMGGDPNPGSCRGPCDLTAVRGRFANFDSPSNPAAVYRRGQVVTIKYHRNNHGPGGFVRHTIVPVDHMMSKQVHERNAFHYSCFGAHPVVARQSDLERDRWGYNIAGTDGLKGIPPAYYESKIVIPDVVPDGDYVFGWVWFGGTGAQVSNGPYTVAPYPKGYFTDYWSCSFVRIEGGNPLASEWTPEFVNDMDKFSKEGCMAMNDSPGICRSEPCLVPGEYQAPRDFKRGRTPRPLTPAHFGYRGPVAAAAAAPSQSGAPTDRDGSRAPEMEEAEDEGDAYVTGRRACRCIAEGENCGRRMSRRTGRICRRRTEAKYQSRECVQACCYVCRGSDAGSRRVCQERNVRRVCGF